jgi:hypothetical protein
MPDKRGLSEGHKTTRGGERVLIRPACPEDAALYPEFLADVNAEDLRLRFFARIAELSADEINWLSHLNYQHEMAFIGVYGDVLVENTAMLQMCVGFNEEDIGSGLRRVVLDLKNTADDH